MQFQLHSSMHGGFGEANLNHTVLQKVKSVKFTKQI
jgi:hypothetical protein